MVGGARSRTSAAALLPCGVHAALVDRRHRAWQNKTEVYGLLFKAASETMLTIAADPKHRDARTAPRRCCIAGARRSLTIPTSI